MSVWSKLRGTIETIFQIGLGGPQIKNNSGVVEARNAGDTGFVVVRGATPVLDNDLTTKGYVDTVATPIVVSGQFNGGSAIGTNTTTEQYFVVTTTGGTASIGQLIWDDGTNTGNRTVIPTAARLIVTQSALTGGSITFKADSTYVWDTGATAWINAGGTANSGPVRAIKYAVTSAGGATQDSASQIPGNAIVKEVMISITTPFSGGTTLSVGQAGSLALLMATTDSTPTVAGLYSVPIDPGAVSWGASPLVVRTTVAGSPAAGAGSVIVYYTQPDA